MMIIRDQQPLEVAKENAMSKMKHNGRAPELSLPPIVLKRNEARRLSTLANSSVALFPRVAHFLARGRRNVQRWSRTTAICAAQSGWVRMCAIAMTKPVTFEMSCWCIRTKPIFH